MIQIYAYVIIYMLHGCTDCILCKEIIDWKYFMLKETVAVVAWLKPSIFLQELNFLNATVDLRRMPDFIWWPLWFHQKKNNSCPRHPVIPPEVWCLIGIFFGSKWHLFSRWPWMSREYTIFPINSSRILHLFFHRQNLKTTRTFPSTSFPFPGMSQEISKILVTGWTNPLCILG